ncbi:hypothetical protein SCHPADRAFT_939545 [Schizopora paradoxa]|uniref:MYND-type domain-containing protein n=1 Tax=Schizopora paradoxa TaxID=27342 RepID=A0A0H2RRA2_9AGAM|nr:hypothetical protein SCHPADRAFT_939545 [Schizopora paradoxa]
MKMHLTVNPGMAHINYIATIVPLSNEASALFRQGKFAEAEKKHIEVLALKELDFGRDDTKVAITLNDLGETQLKLNKLDAAEENLRRAVTIWEADDKLGVDAAIARESLAQKYKSDEAKALRVRGSSSVLCGNNDCPANKVPGKVELLKLEDMKACKFCKSVFYCSENCRSIDWTGRHKRLCRVSPRTI